MALKPTNLTIQMAPLPATFRGTPQDLATQMLLRMRILSPSGSSFIFEGDSKPTSNVGPWLKGGTQWYVWDNAISDYVPLDISASFTPPAWIGFSVPAGTNPIVWLKTTKDATDVDPTYGDPIGWFVWNGSAWVSFTTPVLSGSTASRPAAPEDYQQYYDATIGVLIWWERGQWRTVSGVPGDVKPVAFSTLEDALTHNPGWSLFGSSFPAAYGRVISQATKDPGASPVSEVNPGAGIAPRAAFETFSDSKGVVEDPADTLVLPAELALWHLVKL